MHKAQELLCYRNGPSILFEIFLKVQASESDHEKIFQGCNDQTGNSAKFFGFSKCSGRSGLVDREIDSVWPMTIDHMHDLASMELFYFLNLYMYILIHLAFNMLRVLAILDGCLCN